MLMLLCVGLVWRCGVYCILNAFTLGCDCCCDSWCGSWEEISEFGLFCVCVQGCTESGVFQQVL